jgi:hypothetical protein
MAVIMAMAAVLIIVRKVFLVLSIGMAVARTTFEQDPNNQGGFLNCCCSISRRKLCGGQGMTIHSLA